MNNYGDPVYDKNNILIGYKTNNINFGLQQEYFTISTFYNENNLLSNKVSVREFDENSLSFKKDILIS
jgi:hypothetical protein